MARAKDVVYMAEYIKNVLYFATVRDNKEIKSSLDTHYFCIDNELIYENYYQDFGPLNIGCVYKYCNLLTEKLKLYLNKQVIVHYASVNPKKAANAAFLMGCYGVLYLGYTPKDAMKPLTMNGLHNYRPFQDAVQGDSTYTITILDCLKGIKKAHELGFFDFKDFNYEEYERLDKIAGGDLNWIVPGKFLAFIGPVDFSVSLYHPPEMYIDYFLENDVKIVVRLNKRLYDGNVFNNVGICHHDLFFADGSCPPRHILFKFLQLSEDSECAIAVHCKAGLGRTGSLIGSYLIKHYQMSAREAIAWMRICRPGSVIGAQQGWLEEMEAWLLKQGNMFRKKRYNDVRRIPMHAYGIYSMAKKHAIKNAVFIEKAKKSPPPIQRAIRLDVSPTPRPKASRFREALNKTQKDHQWSVRTPRDDFQEILKKRDQHERSRSISRRGSGAGEPRNSSSVGTKQYIPGKSNANNKLDNGTKQIASNNGIFIRSVRGSRPIPMSMSPVRTTVPDNRNSQLTGADSKRTGQKNERVTRVNQAFTVAPHNLYRLPVVTRDRTPSSFSTAASKGSINQAPRRRLGRSPSPNPSPSRAPDQNRTTNTPTCSRTLSRDKTALKKVISQLKVFTRDGSTGAQSFGAASLGAQREAPAPAAAQRAPRVRSDERTIATQGDLLNSIKFQRWICENKSIDAKMNKNFHDTFSKIKNKEVIRNSSAAKWSGNDNSSTMKLRSRNTSREKSIPSKTGLNAFRSSSPKGKKNLYNPYY